MIKNWNELALMHESLLKDRIRLVKLAKKNRSLWSLLTGRKTALDIYLENPVGFDFIKGEIVSSHYTPADKGKGTIRAEIKGDEGSLLMIEVSPSIWPFTTKEAEECLRDGDDWYDLKGKRPLLPAPVYLLKHKEHGSVLIGIDQRYLEVLKHF